MPGEAQERQSASAAESAARHPTVAARACSRRTCNRRPRLRCRLPRSPFGSNGTQVLGAAIRRTTPTNRSSQRGMTIGEFSSAIDAFAPRHAVVLQTMDSHIHVIDWARGATNEPDDGARQDRQSEDEAERDALVQTWHGCLSVLRGRQHDSQELTYPIIGRRRCLPVHQLDRERGAGSQALGSSPCRPIRSAP